MIALQIRESPATQVISLHENATFHCSASGDIFQCNVDLGSRSFHFSHSDVKPGVVVMIESEGSGEIEFSANITVEGTLENNNTQVYCTVWSSGRESYKDSNTAEMVLIGKLQDQAVVGTRVKWLLLLQVLQVFLLL